jgi:hypothetical protein
VVFGFYNNRVFASCMDQECRRALSFNMKSYYIMAKELEEEIFTTKQMHKNRAMEEGNNMHHISNHMQSILSRLQVDFLDSIKKKKQELVQAYQQSTVSPPAPPLERIHLRELCKVPWR